MKKGWGLWKKEWYSICSQHQQYNKDCYICHYGTWENCWITYLRSKYEKWVRHR